MRKLLLLTVVAFLSSCTAKNLECTTIVDMTELSKPLDGKDYVITLESDYILVDEKTFKSYKIGDTFCK